MSVQVKARTTFTSSNGPLAVEITFKVAKNAIASVVKDLTISLRKDSDGGRKITKKERQALFVNAGQALKASILQYLETPEFEAHVREAVTQLDDDTEGAVVVE